ncbi:LysE family translocator [Pseudocolwellia agarivorans]|uniref:LysE family translocator n=1 Tax=Pseudocolwellia agarivorans TaxID=1911682 RepID=UPI003F88309D
MDLIQGLIVITTIHFLAAAAPGPDFVLVSQQTLSHGKKTGLFCSLGITLGLSIHLIYSALGLAAIIANSSSALWAIKIIGGSYLMYLGYKGLTSKKTSKIASNETAQPEAKKNSPLKSIGSGFLCNALNPKAPIYFVSLFTLVLSPDLPLSHLLIYGAWIMAIQFIWFSSVVFLLSRPAVNRKFKAIGHWVDRVMGVAMIALGIKVITSKLN